MSAEVASVLWVLQSDGLGATHLDAGTKLIEFLDLLGIPHRTVEVRPFADADPIAVAWDGPVVFYGSTLLVRRVCEQNRGQWIPGVWHDRERFGFAAQRDGFWDLFLNNRGLVAPLGAWIASAGHLAGTRFVKPAHDLKAFTGGVMTGAELRGLVGAGSTGTATLNTEVVVAPVQALNREWRTIVVHGKVITGSLYRAGGRARWGGPEVLGRGDYGTLPAEVLDFANAAAARYCPANVFVLDVGELEGGGLRVVECNTFNCSGWYWSDFYAIVAAVSRAALDAWQADVRTRAGANLAHWREHPAGWDAGDPADRKAGR